MCMFLNVSKTLKLLAAQIERDKALSPQEIQAIASFLSDSVAEFAGLGSSDVALKVGFCCT